MHDVSKVALFMDGVCGYKDGEGGSLWDMRAAPCGTWEISTCSANRLHLGKLFNESFASLETQFRTKGGCIGGCMELQDIAANHMGGKSPKLNFASNFNVARCTSDMKQHVNAIRMWKAMITHEARFPPSKTKHTFKGERWNELVEIMALEQLVGALAFKAQHETAATAGHWHMWLTRACL
jgi:hypothetical protein